MLIIHFNKDLSHLEGTYLFMQPTYDIIGLYVCLALNSGSEFFC